MTKITIIIPTFNRQKYIVKCINSVRSQSFRDFEIIIVDDNSTDNTKELLSEFINLDYIKYFRTTGKGPSNARNLGLKKSSGEYIAFLDSDDLFLPDKLKTQVDYISKNPKAKFVHSNYNKFDDYGNYLGSRDTSFYNGHIFPEILSHWKVLIAISCVLIKKEIFKEIGNFDETLTFGEDLDMWARISKKYEFHHVPENLSKIRIHDHNLSKRNMPFSEIHKPYITNVLSNNKDLPISEIKKISYFYNLFVAMNYLIEGSSSDMLIIRIYFKSAIKIKPLAIYSYFGIMVSFLPSKLRIILGIIYRKFVFNIPYIFNKSTINIQ